MTALASEETTHQTQLTQTHAKAAECGQHPAASVTTLNTSDTALATGVPVNGKAANALAEPVDHWAEHVKKHNLGKPVALPEEDPLFEVKDRVSDEVKMTHCDD